MANSFLSPDPKENILIGVLSVVVAIIGLLFLIALLLYGLKSRDATFDVSDTIYQYGLFGFPALGCVLGIIAVITKRGRRWGIAGLVLNAGSLCFFLLLMAIMANGLAFH